MLYKYYPCEIYNLDALANGYLWFSNPKILNDPFDCNFGGFRNSKAFAVYSKDQQQQMYELFEKFGICSFTQDPCNQHFWSLYANNYSGFCLVFDENELNRKLISLGIMLEKVKYLPESFKIDTVLAHQLTRVNEFKVAIDRTLREASYSKSKDVWGNESEIRAFLGLICIENISSGENDVVDEKVGYKVPIKKDNLLKGIVLGQNMSKENKELILNIVQKNYPLIKISKIELDYENWSLKVVDF